ncbi:GNAT family N-acetyltransferase [Amaricoccus tamworthensis]|uniref:GNAT family N-acetyltransferase n=1 Tax=Amaricoccus tamworthensis TaxID=57002 RepID=UPI003C7A5169
MELTVRPATTADAAAGVEVLRRSITELCVEDHGKEPSELKPWLRNKTVADWTGWVNGSGSSLFMAFLSDRACGVGMVSWHGEVLLNYVHPDFRFQGVSTAVLNVLEQEAALRGTTRMTLESTRTAEGFYRARGYVPVAGGNGPWMEKTLLPADDRPITEPG